MSDSESLDYLQPGFDPWSLTMPRLRSILVTHDVQYPATAKKAQLVEIFNENIVPRSRKILAARARAKRSSKGIVDADSQPDSQETIVAAPSVISDSELMPPPPRSTRKPSSRRAESEESSAAGSTSAALHGSPTKKKTSSRSRQRASAATSDTDTAPPTDGDYGGGALAPPPTSTRKRGRPKKSEVSVRTTDDEDDEILKRSFESSAADSVFSSDNPFQSGSSPPPVVVPFKSPSAASSRRKTTGVDVAGGRDTTISAKVKGSDRRRTDVGLSSGGHGTVERKVSKTIAAPVSRTKTAESKVKPELVEAGEEFTPEEQMDLARQPGGRDAGKEVAKRTKRKKSGGIGLGNAFLILLGALLTAYAAWYRQEKIAVGYCGVGRPATQVIPPEYEDKVPVWLKKLVEPECEVCPPHAYCSSGFVAECEPDYVLRPHPLSLFGIVPLPPTCEPDGEKVRRVKAVADKAVEELRERRAKFECGELVDADGKPEDSPAIDADDLKEVVSSKRSRRMSKQEFDDLWAAAIGDITSRDEVEVEVQQPPQPPANDTTGGAPDSGRVRGPRLLSTSLARLPLLCAIRRSVRLGLARHRGTIGGLIALALAGLYARARFRRRQADAALVPGLVDVVLDRLANQKLLSEEEGEEVYEPFLFLPHLRDDVLRSIHSARERERIWSLVRPIVELNSNVRTSQREGRHGDVGRAWEWIGAVGAADDGVESAARRRRSRSARVSWGKDVRGGSGDDESTLQKLDEAAAKEPEMVERPTGGPANPNPARIGLHQKWEDSRPIY